MGAGNPKTPSPGIIPPPSPPQAGVPVLTAAAAGAVHLDLAAELVVPVEDVGPEDGLLEAELGVPLDAHPPLQDLCVGRGWGGGGQHREGGNLQPPGDSQPLAGTSHPTGTHSPRRGVPAAPMGTRSAAWGPATPWGASSPRQGPRAPGGDCWGPAAPGGTGSPGQGPATPGRASSPVHPPQAGPGSSQPQEHRPAAPNTPCQERPPRRGVPDL